MDACAGHRTPARDHIQPVGAFRDAVASAVMGGLQLIVTVSQPHLPLDVDNTISPP